MVSRHPMRVAVTGADGQLGSELQRVLQQETVIPLVWPSFDLLKPDAEEQVVATGAQAIIHAAAYTNVDGAEEQRDLAMAINAEGTTKVARAAQRLQARLICVSTDYVFDGTKQTPYLETDAPNPLNVYGRSKREGERVALDLCDNCLIVRTAWLYGAHGNNFVKTIMRLAMERPDLRVVADQRGCPTYAGDLADALVLLLRRSRRGLLHLAGSGDCTWHGFASAIVRHMGVHIPVHPVRTEEFKRPAVRPPYSVLSDGQAVEEGVALPAWEDGLSRFMALSSRSATSASR